MQEIRDAQNGLLNLIDGVKRELAGQLSDADRQQLEAIYSQASNWLDWTEVYVPR